MSRIVTGLAISADGYIAGPDDGPQQPLGVGGMRLFDFFGSGDTPSRFYDRFKMSPVSAALFDAAAGANGAVISGRRTYDITNGWGGKGPMPGVPLFVMTHSVPADAPVASRRTRSSPTGSRARWRRPRRSRGIGTSR
jgi:hypothetical protein